MDVIRFKDACRLWETEKLKYVKASSLAAYSFVIRKHLEPYFSTLDDVTNESVQELVDRNLNEGMTLTTAKRIVLILEMISRFCERRGWMDLLTFKPIYPARKEKYKPEIITVREEKKLIRHLTENPKPLNLGLLICICCGLRNGEICGLKWSDIDFDNKIIYIRRTVYRLNGYMESATRSRLVIGLPKTADSSREVPVADSLLRILKSYNPGNADDSIFLMSGTHRPTDPQTFRNNFRNVLSRLGLPRHKVHSLRHTFATRCIESKCDVKTLSSILGHSNVSTTLNLYVHPDREQKRKCVENMMKLL